MAAIDEALDAAVAGRGRLVLLVGEPGVGKSRMIEEVAARAQARGAEVLLGRCYEDEGAPAFWPWVQIVRAFARHRGDDEFVAAVGTEAADIAQIAPDILARLPAAPAPTSRDAESARFRLFDAMATFLCRAAPTRPIVILLDDLHGADVPSLLLLRFLAGQVGDAPLLVVGTFRDAALIQGHLLAETLTELLRAPAGERLTLRGLDHGSVARFIEVASGIVPPSLLVTEVHRRTNGNPLFLTEVVRALLESGELARAAAGAAVAITIPDGVRVAITRRLARLSEACLRTLRVASGFGREFREDALARAAGVERAELGGVLGEALAARVVVEVPEHAGRYRFVHALTRDALYDETPAPSRPALHGRLGEALEAATSGDADPPLAELAAHFLAAGDSRGIEFARRAGDRAVAVLAYEEAARQYEAALQALDRGVPASEETRCEILLALGRARATAGDRSRARETFESAAKLARRLGAAEQLAKAALGFASKAIEAGFVDEGVLHLIDEALQALPAGDSALRARLMARLSQELQSADLVERRMSLSRQAVEMARRAGDLEALCESLVARHVALRGPGNAEERLAISTEIARLGWKDGNKELAGWGLAFRIVDRLELGDLGGAEQDSEACARLGAELRQPLLMWVTHLHRSVRALLAGRFDESERLAEEALALGQPVDPDAAQLFGAQLLAIRGEQGRLEELEPVVREFVEQYPTVPAWRAALGALYAELGRAPEARSELEQVAVHDFADMQRDATWLLAGTSLAEICAFLGDDRRAATLYDLLVPYAAQHVVAANATWKGPVVYYLGLLATTMRRWELAVEHLEDAIRTYVAIGARPNLARAQLAYATMLLARGEAVDRARAEALLREARATAEALGMGSLLPRIDALLDTMPTPAGAADVNVFRREGEYWTLAYAGTAIRLRNTNGLLYIAHLLAHPGQTIHVADLAARAVLDGGSGGQERPGTSRDLGAILDPQATAAYRTRLADLHEELDDATASGDARRAECARQEIEAITRELSAAYGLGGRARKAGDAGERARKAVTNQIRRVLERIRDAHPALGRHLANAIRTGFLCAYLPEEPVVWLL